MASLCGFSGRFQVILAFPLWYFFLAANLAPVDAIVDAATVTVNRSDEVSALLEFKDNNDISGPEYWANWKETDATPCAWIGVTCTANYTVEELDFSGWGLGVCNFSSLFDLTDLSRFDFSSNYLECGIDSISNFSKLTYLDLSHNTLAGITIDFIGNFTGLTYLDVSYTTLYELPPSISLCKNLRFLYLQSNWITSLPPSMSDLLNLQVFSLADNSYTGPFPIAELGNLTSLVSLDLSTNSFSGSIPSLPNLGNLLVLNLDNNNFTGFEQSDVFTAPQSLQELHVSNNQLEGTIPSTLTNLVNLNILNMSVNRLSGDIPAVVSLLMSEHSLQALDLSQNMLTGQIPTDLLLQNNFVSGSSSVNLSHNLLSGNIPSRVNDSDLKVFSTLDFSYNNLSGPFPPDIAKNPNIRIDSLQLNDNLLSGDIVDLFLSPARARVEFLQLRNNLFTGDLSRIANYNISAISGTSFPLTMDLRNNRLQWSKSDTIPDPISATLEMLSSVSYIVDFRVGGNNFSGTSLPTTCFLNRTQDFLYVLDFSNCQLNGEIFGAAFNSTCLAGIQLLNLSNNHVTGQLSESVITQAYQDFIIDVSKNNLSGPLPTILPSSSMYNPKYFGGNRGLCGLPLSPCPHQGTAGVQWWVVFITIGGSLIIAAGSCLAATWRWRVYHKRHQQDADLIKTLLERDASVLMPLRELKKATENFAESSQIGEGGFGTVYIGRLNNGTMVAIKRSKREGSEKDKEQFLNEVRILSQVNHRNLVKLLGCCLENKVAVLVFEFISNGTLQEHLQGKFGTDCLKWKQRLNIALQTADALNYLHSAASFPIYHRDVKSANILLDDELNAKVADFGISKLAPLRATHVSTLAIQGTIGYMDPEYYTSYQLTDKTDVYSFGVVLLELISAKPALDFARSEEETSLVYLASKYIERGELEGLIDPALREIYNDQVGNGRESIMRVGQLAMKCLTMRSKARPSMKEVSKELQNLWAQLDKDTSNNLETSMNEHDDGDLQCTERILLNPSGDSLGDKSSFVMESDSNGIQMSQFFRVRAADKHS